MRHAPIELGMPALAPTENYAFPPSGLARAMDLALNDTPCLGRPSLMLAHKVQMLGDQQRT
jgi:hypothetical protein